jgi:hypothetical protein
MESTRTTTIAMTLACTLALCGLAAGVLWREVTGKDGGRADAGGERAVSESGLGSGTGSGTESGSASHSESETESDSESQSGSEAGSESGSESGSDSESGSVSAERREPSPHVGERVAELAALAERGDVTALPWLQASVLAEQPDLAPTIVLTVARLAELAPDEQRDAAARRLGEWLQAESTRAGRDARGNAAVLVEALARTGSPQAALELSSALDTRGLPLHLETLAVQGLFKLGDPRARESVHRWQERVAQLPARDGLERALRNEAELAARATLASLGS